MTLTHRTKTRFTDQSEPIWVYSIIHIRQIYPNYLLRIFSDPISSLSLVYPLNDPTLNLPDPRIGLCAISSSATILCKNHLILTNYSQVYPYFVRFWLNFTLNRAFYLACFYINFVEFQVYSLWL